MAKTLFQTLREKLGQGEVQLELTPELEARIEDIHELFPESIAITPATTINPEWCFHIELDNGDRFLAWVHTNHLTGMSKEDGEAPFPDCEPAKSLRHPNILKPVLVDEVGSHTIIVTDDFEGSSLLYLMERRKFEFNEVAKIFQDLAVILRIAHDEKMIHRAVNPANILVDEELNVQIFGLGLANMFYEQWNSLLRKTGRRIDEYIAPELANTGLVSAVPHCDGYSIARVSYELLTGQLPKDYVLLPSQTAKVPTYLDDALLSAMHSEPEKRPQTIAELYKFFLGKNKKEDDDSATRMSATERISTIFDQYFQWVHSDIFKVAVVLVVFGMVLLGFYLHERFRIDPVLASLDTGYPNTSVGDLNVLVPGPVAEQPVTNYNQYANSTEVVINNDNTKPSNVVTGVINSTPAIAPRRANPGNVKIRTVPTNARKFNSSTNTGNPNRPGQNPLTIPPIVEALTLLKKKNPAQTEWNYHLLVTRERTILDLSGHANLTDISPLHGQVINELDLSSTGVDKIFDLIGMPLDELRLDNTSVTDLDPVVGLPLGVLTFTDTSIKNLAAVRRIPSLTCLHGNDLNGPLVEVKPPFPGQKTWINQQGVKFRALPGIAAMMAVDEFPAKDGSGPMTSVTYKEAENLCSHMTIRERRDGKIGVHHRYRLPTDGEWSFAALLPESRFLSPKGRMLQRLDVTDFENHQSDRILIEESEGKVEPCGYGFCGMNNEIGEWVDQNHGHWDGTNVVRGLPIGSDLENLRHRTNETSETSSPIIGFRPVLEVDQTSGSFSSFDGINPETLSRKHIESSESPHLRAAAQSASILKSLLTMPSYRESFINNQTFERDPFENRFYLRIDVPMTWTRARAVAQQVGGRLATASGRNHLAWINDRYMESSSLGSPLWMGASAFPYKADWNWVSGGPVANEILPGRVDSDKRRGAVLAAGLDTASPLTATPVSEKHSFLIEWD